jgi:hypothetical protein
MRELTSDKRRRYVERYRNELIDICSDPDVTAGMETARWELDRIAAKAVCSGQDLASAVVESFRWSDQLLARGLFAVLQEANPGGWKHVMAAAGYRLAEISLQYRLSRELGRPLPEYVHAYIPFCNAFLAVCCLGDDASQRRFAQVVLKLGRDGVRAGSADEDSFPAFVEAIASEVLEPGTGLPRLPSIDHPFARVAARRGESDAYWSDIEKALDLHLMLCDESTAAGALRQLNYPAVGLALFPAPVLVAMRVANVPQRGKSQSVHPLMELPSANPPTGLPLDSDSNSTLTALLRQAAL